MKPKRIVNLMICPRCGRLDNVSLVADTRAIFWCACGAVFKMCIDEENKCIKEYDFYGNVD